MNIRLKVVIPFTCMLLSTSGISMAGVESIRSNNARQVASIQSTAPSSATQVDSESLSTANNELRSEITDTTNAISINVRESDKNTNQLNNAGIRVSNLQTTRTNHHQRITDLENKPPAPKPTWVTISTGSTSGTVNFPSNYLGQVRMNGQILTNGSPTVSGYASVTNHDRCHSIPNGRSISCSGKVNARSITGCAKDQTVQRRYPINCSNGSCVCLNENVTLRARGHLPATIQILVNQ